MSSRITIPLADPPAALAGGADEPFAGRFASFVGAKRGIPFRNAEEAFDALFCAVPLTVGARVLVSSCSSGSLWEALRALKLEPVVIEPDPFTLLLDGGSVAPDLWSKVDAIVISHLFGRPAPLENLVASARKFGVFVVEDALHAHGAEYRGKKVGSFGDAAVFDFRPGRILADEEGGAVVVTPRAALADALKPEAKAFSKAANRRLNAALDQIEDTLKQREALVAAYRERLAKLEGLRVVLPERQGRHVFYRFVIRVPQAEAIRAFLAERGIETASPRFRALETHPELPLAGAASRETLYLPMSLLNGVKGVAKVCEALHEALVSLRVGALPGDPK